LSIVGLLAPMPQLYRLLFGFLLVFGAFSAFSQANVTITPAATVGGVPICVGGAPVNLTNIIIAETDAGNGLDDDVIGGPFADWINVTLTLGIPADFQFVPGVGSVFSTPGVDDVVINSFTILANSISITFSAFNNTGTDKFDAIIISGLQVRAVSGPAQTLNITRTGGTANIQGLVNGTIVGSVTSALPPSPSTVGPASACANQAGLVYTTANVVGNTYAWSVVGGSITAGAGTNSITVTWGSAGAGTVQVTQTVSATGCATTTPLYNVTVNPNPTPTISGSNAVCANQAGVVYSTTNNVGHTYSWAVTGGTIVGPSTNNSVTVNWGVAGAGTVRVTETTAAGCSVQTPFYNVTINTNPAPSIVGPATACANQAGLVYTTANVVGNTYAWSVVGGSITAGAGTNSIAVTWGSAGAGTVQVTQTVTATGCATTTPLYNVTVNPTPTPVITGLNSVCANQSGVVYSTPFTAGHQYLWEIISGGTIVGSPNNNTVSVNWGVAGSGQIRVTETIIASGCATQTSAFNVTINANPLPSISGADQVCADQTSALYLYSTPETPGNTYNWNVIDGTIAGGSGTGTIAVQWGAAGVGQVSVIETVSATGCSTGSLPFNVTINPSPTPVIIGSNTACTNQTGVVYSTALNAGRTYLWEVVSGGSIVGSATNNSVTVNWGAAGTGQLRVTETITASGCSVTTSLYNVTINTNPAPSIVGPATACANQAGLVYTTANIVGNTYAWSVVGGSITAGAGTNSITVTWGSAGAGTVQVTQTVSATGCATTTPLYNVTVNPNPTPTISGSNAVCANQAGVVYSTTNNVGHTYLWAVTGGTIVGPSTNNSVTVDWGVAGAGTVRVTETITASGCSVQTPFYNVTINTNPAPSIVGPATACANQAGLVYTTANVVGNTYAWSVVGGSITTGAGTNSITVTWGSAGAGTVQVTQTVSATGCATTTPLYNVTVNPNPTPMISGNNSVCAGEQNVIYSVALNAGRTYNWTVTGGTIDGPSNGNSIVVDWGAAGIGTVAVLETISASGCSTLTPDLIVTINNSPSPIISGLSTVCANTPGVVYSTPNVIGDLFSWSVVGGTIVAGAGTNSITVNWGAAGAGSVTVTQFILSSSCTVTTPPYNVTIEAIPTPSITGDNTVCENAQNKVYSTPLVVGHTYAWVVTGGTIDGSSTGNSIVVDWGIAGTGTIQLTETITASGCFITTPIFNVNINTLPAPVITGLTIVCANDAGVIYSTPNSPGNTYTWSVSGGSIVSGAGTNSITVNWGAAGAGTVEVTEVVPSSSCITTTPVYSVTINPTPAPVISGDNTVCANEQNVIYTSPFTAGNTYSWNVTGGTINGPSTNNTVTVDWGVAGPGTLTLTESVGGCTTVTPVYNVTINPNPTPVIAGNTNVCRTETGVIYSTPQVVGNTYAWTVVGGTIDSGAGTNQISVTWTSAGTGSISVVETITATGCNTSASPLLVTVSPNPIVNAGSDHEICQGLAFNFATQTSPATASNFVSLLWTTTGTGVLTGATTLTPNYTPGVGETGAITFTLTADGIGTCVDVADQMILNITPLPTASAGSDSETCAGSIFNFSTQTTPASATSFATLAWSHTGTGTLFNPNTIAPTYLPGAGETGTITFTLLATSTGSCASVSDQMDLVITPSPTVNAGGDAEICQGSNFNFSAQVPLATATNFASLLWTTTGTGTLTGANTLTPSYTPGIGETGFVTFTLTATGNGSCASVQDAMILQITPAPLVNAGSDAEICQGSNFSFVTQSIPASASNFASILWTTTGTGTLFNATTLTPTYIPQAGETGAITFTLTANGNGSCASINDQMILNITPSAIVSAGSDAETCQGVTYNFITQSTPASAINFNTINWTTTGTGLLTNANTLTPSYAPGVGETGNVIFTLTATGNGSCTTVNDQMVLTITPAPAVFAGSDAETCQGVTFNFSTQSSPATASQFSSILWTTTGTGILVNATTLSPTYTPGVGETGAVTFTLTANGNGSCASVNDQMILTITPSVIVSAGSDAETCQGVTFNFSTQSTPASASNFNTISWTTTGSGVLLNATTLTPSYTPGVGETGNVTFTLTATGNGSCATLNDQMVLVITPAPLVFAGSDAETCEDVSFNFNTQSTLASASNFASILWTHTGSGTIFNANTLTPTYNPGLGETGNITFTLTATGNGSCTSVNDQMILTITPEPSVFAGSDAETCQGVAFNFSTQSTPASASDFASLLWTHSGTGTLTNATTLTPSYTPGVGETGNVTFTLTANGNGSCASVNDQMILIITPAPVAFAGSDAETCQGVSFNFSTQATPASASNQSSLLWTHSGTGTIFNATTLTPTYQPGVGEAGNVTFTLTVNGNGSCVSVNDQMILVITPAPVVNAGSNAETCQGVAFNFSTQSTAASATNFSSILWTTTGTGILTNATTFTPTYTPGAGETGAVTFTLTASGNGSCASVNDQMILTITPAPVVSAGSDSETCQGVNFNFSTQSTLASVSNFSSILWTTTGTGLLSNANTLTPTYAPGAGETGVVTFTLTASGNGSCVSVNDQMILTITPAPTVFAGSDAETCQGVAYNFTTQSLPSSATNFQSILWTSTGTGTINNANTLTPTYIPGVGETGNVIFTLTATGNGSCATIQDQMTLVVTPAPIIFAGSDSETCQGVNFNFSTQSTLATASNFATIAWTTTGTGILFNATTLTPTYQPGVGEAGNVTFTLTGTGNGSCAAVNDQMVLTITPSVIVSAGSDAEICEGSIFNFTAQSILASASNFNTLTWTTTGTGLLTNANTLTPTYTPGAGETGNLTFTLTASGNGTCVSLNDAMILRITPAIIVSAGSDQEICQGSVINFATQAIPASASNYSSLLWTHNGAGTLFNATTLVPTYFSSPGETGLITFTLTAIGNGSCASQNDFMTLTITPAPVVIAGSNDAICEGTPTFNFASRSITASSSNGSILWSHTGTGSLDDATALNPVYTVGAGDINTTITFTLTVTSASAQCAAVNSSFNLLVNPRALVSVPATSVDVCEPTTISLTGTIGGSANAGSWSLITGTGTLSTSSITGLTVSASYTTTLADVGNTLTFRLTTNDPDGAGPCVPAFIDVDFNVNESAKVNAGADFAICEYNDIILNGSFSGATSSVTWTGGTNNFDVATNPITGYTLSPAERAATNLSLTFTLTTNDPPGVCPAVSDQVVVAVRDTLNFVTIVGLDPVYAENNDPVSMTGVPAGGIFSGPGVSGNTFFPSIANLTPAVNIITYTYQDPTTGCFSSPNKQVIVNPITTVDFRVTTELPDPLGLANGYICANQGDLVLREEPNEDIPLLVPPSEAVFTSPDLPAGRIYFDGSGPVADQSFKLRTDGLAPGLYTIIYTFTNSFGAANPVARIIRVTAAPRAIIDNANSCIDSSINFTESSDIPGSNPYGAFITNFVWDFGDGNGSTQQDPTYQYSASGQYNLKLRVTTNEGCFRDTLKTIRVGPIPTMAFTWSEFCNGNDTKFVDNTNPGISTIDFYTWVFDDGFMVSGPAGSPIPGGTNGGRTTGTFTNPNHRYDTFGQYDVQLSVVTNDGCTNNLIRNVFIQSYGTPSVSAGYFEDFELSPGTWVQTKANNGAQVADLITTENSWVWGTPSGSIVNSAATGSVNAWWTGLNPNALTTNSTYYNTEKSAVIGPCLNLTNIERPMISVDYWSDLEDQRDGAVLQYSVDGGVNWLAVGDISGAGLNWYNRGALVGNPGLQNIGQFGWTGIQSNWKTARFNLDMIDPAERHEVIFRIAFGSDENNGTPSRPFEGFAFDNIFIGEKERNVLVEYFYNSGISLNTNDYLNNLFRDQTTQSIPGPPFAKGKSDFFKIQYHIANPSNDILNQDNPVDPAARSLFYGVSQPPAAIMDGVLGNYFGTIFNGDQAKITARELDKRALEDPLFRISVTQNPNPTDSINALLNFEYIGINTYNAPVTFHLALIDSIVGTAPNANIHVLRKLLLGTEGLTVDSSWSTGTTKLVPVKSIIDVPVANGNNLWLVAFVQDRTTKRIHQSYVVRSLPKTSSTVVGLGDDPVLAQIRDIIVFPNPASKNVNFALENGFNQLARAEGYTWSIVDQRGIIVHRGKLQEDLTYPQEVDIDKLANGMYIIIFNKGDRIVTQRKLAVMNRH